MNILKALFLDDLISFLDFYFHHFPKNILRNYFDNIYFWDQTLKVRVNLRNIKKPLYGDYTLIGFFIALPYRVLRIFLGILLYFFIFLFYLAILLLWIFLPLFFLFKIFQ